MVVKRDPVLLCSYGACVMSGLLRCNPQTVVQGSEAGLWSSNQALSIADRGLSAPQRQQDGLQEKRGNKSC